MGATSPRTVFVLGAGASAEVELPVGTQLKEEISTLLDIRFERLSRRVSGDELLFAAFDKALRKGLFQGSSINDVLGVARQIAGALSLAISIDNYIDAHRDNKLVDVCGKMAIVRAILAAERRSTLHFDRTKQHSPSFSRVSGTWFNKFFQILTENCRLIDLPARLASVAFVVFNYDRCLEHYLYFAIQKYYEVDQEQAASVLGELHVFHPYGTVGMLPWMDKSGGVDFGLEPQVSRILDLFHQVKTFTEGTDPSSDQLTRARSALLAAEQVVFLGFAFHPMNVSLLCPDRATSPPTAKRKAFGTAHRMSESDAAVVANDLASRLGIAETGVHIRTDKRCSELLGEYSRTLSFA